MSKRLSPRSVEICRTVLHAILEDARRKGYIFVNPLENVRRFDVPARELAFLKPLQVKALCELVGRFYGVLFLVLSFCGLRIGEATGLKRSDIDLDQGLLYVRRQVIWRRKKECPEGEPRWAFAKPKSKAGMRVVEIPAPLLPLIVAHLETLAGVHNLLDLVFPSEAGTPLDPKNVRRRHFAPALKALGLSGIRQHDMRRTSPCTWRPAPIRNSCRIGSATATSGSPCRRLRYEWSGQRGEMVENPLEVSE